MRLVILAGSTPEIIKASQREVVSALERLQRINSGMVDPLTYDNIISIRRDLARIADKLRAYERG